MKKVLAALIVFLILLGGCSSSPGKSETESDATDSMLSSFASSEDDDDDDDDAVADGEGDIEDCHIKIVSAEVGKDYNDDPVLIVTYQWTNNGDDEQMFSTAFSVKAYQDGIECEDAFMVDGVDTEKLLTEIKPGVTLELKDAYKLDGDSDVEIEVEPWITFDDDPPVVKKTFSVK